MTKDTENRLTEKNTKPTSMRILVYDFLVAQKTALSLSEIEEQLAYADRITIYRTLKPLRKKVLFTVFKKTQLPNTNCAATNATNIHTKTGICIFTVKSVNKRRAGKISFCRKTSKGILELMKSACLRKVFVKIVLMKLCNSIAQWQLLSL